MACEAGAGRLPPSRAAGSRPVGASQLADNQRSRLAALIVIAKRQDSAAAVLEESLVADFLKLLPIPPAQVGRGNGGSRLLRSIVRK